MHFSFYVATQADEEPLRVFGQRLFIETYSAQNTPENMALYCEEAFSVENFRLDFQREETCYLIARIDETMAAYTKLTLNKPPFGTSTSSAVEIARFYLDGPFQGQGLALVFMQRCLDWIREQGYGLVWLGVWPQNPRAVRFYEKIGFTITGSATFLLGTDPQTDYIMQKVL